MTLHLLFVEVARSLLSRTRAPRPLAGNLMTGVVGLCSLIAVIGLIVAVAALIIQPANGFPYAMTAWFFLAAPLARVLLVIIPVVPIVSLRTPRAVVSAG